MANDKPTPTQRERALDAAEEAAIAASSAALRVRVDNLADDLHRLHTELRDLASALSTQIRGLEHKHDTAQRRNWQMWGVAVSALVALGTLAYWPILRSVDKNEIAIAKLLEFVTSDAVVHKNSFETSRAAITTTFAERERRIEQNRAGVERLEATIFTLHGQITAQEARTQDQSARLDAVSRRLAEFIRDQGKHQGP